MTSPRIRHCVAGACCSAVVLLGLFGPAPAQAEDAGLSDVAASIAEEVAAALKGHSVAANQGVRLDPILSRATGGPLAQRTLQRALQSQGVRLSPKSEYVIGGSVEPGGTTRAGSSGAAASIKLSLEGPGLTRQLTGVVQAEQDVIAMLGVTGTLPVKMDRPAIALAAPVPTAGTAVAENAAERKEQLAQLIAHPQPPKVTPNPTPIIADDGRPQLSEVHVGPYGMEILIKDPNGRIQMADGTRYTPRPPVKAESGELYVDIRPGEVYAVRLINDSRNYDTGVKLTIDGLDSFEFSEDPGYKKLGLWIIPHEGSGIIRGWHMRNKEGQMVVAEFEVAKYGEGLAEEMGAYGDVGKITATFRAAWDPDESTPGSMLAYSQPRGSRKGMEVSDRLKEFRRYFGEIRAAISIRYQMAPAE